eukprot:Hpha_TRINITY_DN15890_c0_g2::TRINITY_DN15890_c0_g2_i3::g.191394::m.191394
MHTTTQKKKKHSPSSPMSPPVVPLVPCTFFVCCPTPVRRKMRGGWGWGRRKQTWARQGGRGGVAGQPSTLPFFQFSELLVSAVRRLPALDLLSPRLVGVLDELVKLQHTRAEGVDRTSNDVVHGRGVGGTVVRENKLVHVHDEEGTALLVGGDRHFAETTLVVPLVDDRRVLQPLLGTAPGRHHFEGVLVSPLEEHPTLLASLLLRARHNKGEPTPVFGGGVSQCLQHFCQPREGQPLRLRPRVGARRHRRTRIDITTLGGVFPVVFSFPKLSVDDAKSKKNESDAPHCLHSFGGPPFYPKINQ